MANDSIYTDQQQEKLDKYENILDSLVDTLDGEVKKDTKKNGFVPGRTVRLLLETVATSTESIHKSAANKLKAEANKSNDDVKIMIAQAFKAMATRQEALPDVTDSDRTEMFEKIDIPADMVNEETKIGTGSLSMSDLNKGDSNE